MSNKPDERLDRRDFMIASVATIGASAGLVANAASASAEASTQNAADPASATVYTGDVI